MSTRFRVTIGLAALLITTACTGAQPDERTPSPDDIQETPVGFSNPVYEFNFPDPMIFTGSDGRYWAVATNGNTANVQTLSSTDLISWEQQDDALPELPEWSLAGKVWAPEVAVHDDDRYLMYYTTRAPDPQIQCVSVAVAEAPGGPYRDTSTEPLV